MDPYSLLQAFRRKARSLGAEVVHDEALRVTRSGSRVESVTLAKGGEIGAGAVVNAAGASGVKEIRGHRRGGPSHRVAQALHVRVRVPGAGRARPPHHPARGDRLPAGGPHLPRQLRAAPRVGPTDPGHRDRPRPLRGAHLAGPRGAGAGVRGDQGDERVVLPLRLQHPRRERNRRDDAGARQLLRARGLLRSRPAAVARDGARDQRAHPARRVPHPGPPALRLRAHPRRRSPSSKPTASDAPEPLARSHSRRREREYPTGQPPSRAGEFRGRTCSRRPRRGSGRW